MNIKKLHLGKGKPKELHKKARKNHNLQINCLILAWQNLQVKFAKDQAKNRNICRHGRCSS